MAADPVTAGIDLVNTIIGRFFPDKTQVEKDKIAAAMMQLQQQFELDKSQIAVDAASAAQPGLHFRDGAGWVCVAGFAFSILKSPIEWGCQMIGHPLQLPPVDTQTTQAMLYGLLGLGGLHAAPGVVSAFKQT
jgi:hypothetical protein